MKKWMVVIMGLLGYVKIPVEVVQLSSANEVWLGEVRDFCAKTDPRMARKAEMYLAGQRQLTAFLRSARRIGPM